MYKKLVRQEENDNDDRMKNKKKTLQGEREEMKNNMMRTTGKIEKNKANKTIHSF